MNELNNIRAQSGQSSRTLLDPIKHLALQPVLNLTPPNHEVEHLEDGSLRVLLPQEVLHDRVLGHLGANGEAALDLLLNTGDGLLVLFGGEALGTAQRARHRRCQGRHLEQAQSLVDICLRGERRQPHLRQRLRDAHYGLQLSDGDGDSEALVGVALRLSGATSHQHVAVLQLGTCLR